MQRVLVFFMGSVMFVGLASFQVQKKEKVQWLTVEQLHAAYRQNPKPILVDIYTNWCGWCKVMDKETYNNDKVAAYINEKYYAVKINAESKDSIEWNGKKYGYNATNKVNELAVYLMYGQMSYPSTIFLSSLNAQAANMAGYLKPKQIEPPLKYFGDGAYKTKDYPAFMKNFNASW